MAQAATEDEQLEPSEEERLFAALAEARDARAKLEPKIKRLDTRIKWLATLLGSQPGANRSEVARTAGVSRFSLYAWLRESEELAR